MSWHRDNNWRAIIRSCNLITNQASLTWCELATRIHTVKTQRDAVLRPHLIRCMVRVCLMSRPWALLQWSEERGHFSRLSNSWTVLCDWRTPWSTSHPYEVVNISEQAAIGVVFGRKDKQCLCQSYLYLLQSLFRQRVKDEWAMLAFSPPTNSYWHLALWQLELAGKLLMVSSGKCRFAQAFNRNTLGLIKGLWMGSLGQSGKKTVILSSRWIVRYSLKALLYFIWEEFEFLYVEKISDLIMSITKSILPRGRQGSLQLRNFLKTQSKPAA